MDLSAASGGLESSTSKSNYIQEGPYRGYVYIVLANERLRASVGADLALRLFATIEFRLAQCISHFDDLSIDNCLVKSVRSELV